MNLNKPPISEEQTALEDYVDFLLTDRSNVTPIHRKRSLKGRITNFKLDNNSSETIQSSFSEPVGEIIGLSLASVESSSDKQLVEEVEDVQVDFHPAANADKAEIKKEINQKVELKSELNDATIKKTQQHRELKPNISHDFILESEEDELKKWDAILTQEQESKILAEEKAKKSAKNQSASAFESSSNNKSFNKTETKEDLLYNNRALQTPKLTNDRPPIFDDLLPLKEPDERLANVEKLLSRISLATKTSIQNAERLKPELSADELEILKSESITEISDESVQATFLPRASLKTKDMLPKVFQTLIFNVGRLPLAVPLLKLGGIVHISEAQDITPLVGTPDWFMGLVPNERGNLMVIDTQKYLMPEKIEATRKPYEYLIILDDSNWAIACHSVDEAKNLTQNDIRWSAISSKRPWFGGMVIQYMSAIIEVDELINMLAGHITD